jgi:hypothetical protein
MVYYPQPGDENYDAGAMLGDEVEKLLPPGAGFILLISIPVDPDPDSAHIACVSNLAHPADAALMWARHVLDEEDPQAARTSPPGSVGG